MPEARSLKGNQGIKASGQTFDAHLRKLTGLPQKTASQTAKNGGQLAIRLFKGDTLNQVVSEIPTVYLFTILRSFQSR